jgi:hypothetical protein
LQQRRGQPAAPAPAAPGGETEKSRLLGLGTVASGTLLNLAYALFAAQIAHLAGGAFDLLPVIAAGAGLAVGKDLGQGWARSEESKGKNEQRLKAHH